MRAPACPRLAYVELRADRSVPGEPRHAARSSANTYAACACNGSGSDDASSAPTPLTEFADSWALRMVIIRSSYDLTSATASHAATETPIRP